MFNRIKRAWQLSNKNPEYLEKLSNEQIKAIPNKDYGKAVFITDGSVEDHEEFEREEQGFKGIFGLGK